MLNKIKELSNTPLSGYDIAMRLKGKTKVMTYKELKKHRTIEELLYPYNNCIILYITKKNYGHWTCILEHDDRIEFYDPYKDYLPDDELNEIDENIKMETGQDRPYLLKLLYNSNKEIEYNNYDFQKWDKNIKTCGHHCICRIIFKDFKLDEYYEIMRNLCKEYNLTMDNLVSYIILNM